MHGEDIATQEHAYMAEYSRFKDDEGNPLDYVSFSEENAANASLSAFQPLIPAAGLTLLHTLEGYRSSVTSVAWSPNSKLLASDSYDSTVRVWDLIAGKLHTLEGHTRSACSVAWSPDGRWLASGSSDQTMRVWNPITGELLHTLEGHMGPV